MNFSKCLSLYIDTYTDIWRQNLNLSLNEVKRIYCILIAISYLFFFLFGKTRTCDFAVPVSFAVSGIALTGFRRISVRWTRLYLPLGVA